MREETVYPYDMAKVPPPKGAKPRIRKARLSRKLLWLKTSRLLVLLICTGCFIYYSSIFFEMYSKYPTVVDVAVTFPDEPDLPAITVCNHNVLRKKELCEQDKITCSILDKQPKDFSQVLRKKLALVPLEKILNWSMPASDLFVDFQIVNFENKARNANVSLSMTTWIYFEKRVCYVLNVDWGNKIPFKINDTDSELVMTLDFHPETDFRPNLSAAEVYIHSPIGLPDSRTSHFTANGGKSYSVGIQKTTLLLMEPPYQTKCTNYTKRFTSSKGHDNLSKKIIFAAFLDGRYYIILRDTRENTIAAVTSRGVTFDFVESNIFLPAMLSNKSFLAIKSI